MTAVHLLYKADIIVDRKKQSPNLETFKEPAGNAIPPGYIGSRPGIDS